MVTVARSMLHVSSFVLVGALFCLFWVDRGTAEFVITCITLGIGLVAVGVSVLVVRWSLQREKS